MFAIVDKKNKALDLKAHEEMVLENVKLHQNTITGQWAIETSGKFTHPYPTVDKLEGEGWKCLP